MDELFHISESPLPSLLNPRLMEYHASIRGGEKTIFTEAAIPHVSFAPTVYNCFTAIFTLVSKYMQSSEGIKDGIFFNVYKAMPGPKTRFLSPEELTKKKYVWDAHVNQEWWSLDPIHILFCGTVKIVYDPVPDWIDVYAFNDPRSQVIERSFQPPESFKIKQTLKLRGQKHQMTLFP
jgi:hypothetical protein